MEAISVAGLIVYFPASHGRVRKPVRLALAATVAASLWIWRPWSGIHRIVCLAYLLLTVFIRVEKSVTDLPVESCRKIPHQVPMAQKRHQYAFTLLVVAQALASFFYAQTPGAWAISVFVACLAFWITINLRKQLVVGGAHIQFRITPILLLAWRAISLIGAFVELNTASFIAYACVVCAAPIIFGFLEFKRDVLEALSLYPDASFCVEAFVLSLFAFLGSWGGAITDALDWVALGCSAATLGYTVVRLVPRFYDTVLA